MAHAVDLDRLDDDGGPPLVELSPAARAALDDAHRRDIAARDAAAERERAAQAAARERELAAFLAEPDPVPDEPEMASADGTGPESKKTAVGSSRRARVARQRTAAARDATRSWYGVEPPATPDAKAARWSAIQERDRRRDAAEQRRLLRERSRESGRSDA
ncbi:hypothetical protein [Pseudonocardia sp. KRD291]|uniref:hypothetical protein n=1 Tax=Pseudonocardia sp. KRD291 TaxID=2792007 RepID=UPI001C4A6242|nr:hypothetical protein [Pseudonocardia sp. KRD291]MBW0104905.1 hypothetical protein [Pseudonocardia sp. KRD291]